MCVTLLVVARCKKVILAWFRQYQGVLKYPDAAVYGRAAVIADCGDGRGGTFQRLQDINPEVGFRP